MGGLGRADGGLGDILADGGGGVGGRGATFLMGREGAREGGNGGALIPGGLGAELGGGGVKLPRLMEGVGSAPGIGGRGGAFRLGGRGGTEGVDFSGDDTSEVLAEGGFGDRDVPAPPIARGCPEGLFETLARGGNPVDGPAPDFCAPVACFFEMLAVGGELRFEAMGRSYQRTDPLLQWRSAGLPN